MDLHIKGKKALVAGSSSGLGLAIAEALSQEGVQVALCARTEEDLKKKAQSIAHRTGGKVIYHVADLSNPKEASEFVALSAERLGGVDILVNNAGGPSSTTFLEATDEMWKNAYYLNLQSTITMSRKAVEYMKPQRWGRIITVASISVKQPLDGLILSNTIRAGVVGLSKSMATELAPHGILVNTVCPGYTSTERVEDLARDLAQKNKSSLEEIISQWESSIPIGRLGNPEELANLVVFLASDRASYITGTTIQVDGGFYRGLM